MMNKEAKVIMAGMKAMAQGQARDDNTQTVKWCDLICKFYPVSGTTSWFSRSADITKGLRKAQVISLINIELEACVEARRRHA
jgi:hypothetical protein